MTLSMFTQKQETEEKEPKDIKHFPNYYPSFNLADK